MRALAAGLIGLGLLAPGAASAQARPDEQACRAIYQELVETNTTLSAGSCTLAFTGMGSSGGDVQTALTFLAIGAVCILPGAGLLYGGWVILRKRKS